MENVTTSQSQGMEVAFLRSEVDQLRTALTTVTEALILCQEFIENEIGEMSYFRDSGSYFKLAEVFNNLRSKTHNQLDLNSGFNALSKTESQVIPSCSYTSQQQQRMDSYESENFQFPVIDTDDDEQIEVNVDLNDVNNERQDSRDCDEITISRVYSVFPQRTATPIKSANLQAFAAKHLKPSVPALIKIQESSSGSSNNNRPSPIKRLPIEGKPSMRQRNLLRPNLSSYPVNMKLPKLVIKGTEKRQKPNARQTSNLAAFKSLRIPAPLLPTRQAKFDVPKMENKNRQMKVQVEKVGEESVQKSQNSSKEIKSAKVTETGDTRKRRRSDCPVKCPVCFKGYSSRGVMSRHMKEAHQQEPQFLCFYCPIKFRNGPMRLDHMQKMHATDFNSVICPYCKRKSSSATGKRNHMMLCARKHQNKYSGNQSKEIRNIP